MHMLDWPLPSHWRGFQSEKWNAVRRRVLRMTASWNQDPVSLCSWKKSWHLPPSPILSLDWLSPRSWFTLGQTFSDWGGVLPSSCASLRCFAAEDLCWSVFTVFRAIFCLMSQHVSTCLNMSQLSEDHGEFGASWNWGRSRLCDAIWTGTSLVLWGSARWRGSDAADGSPWPCCAVLHPWSILSSLP